MLYSIVKADNDVFAVFQTIYSNADTNLNYDWDSRLNDTKWTDECYWVMQDGQKIGGILILKDTTQFPFLITPFCDRNLFWYIVLKHIKENSLNITKINSILDDDVRVLLTYGYKVDKSRRMMCRPAEKFQLQIDNRYEARIPDVKNDIDEMVSVVLSGYKDGIDYQLDGAGTDEEARQDILYFLDGYLKTNTLNQSVLIHEKDTGKLIAFIMSGRHPDENRDRFSLIADITVLPEHRGKGIAEYMIKHALTEAVDTSDILTLCVTVGNNAESLYRKMGFWGGPIFTGMSLR